jgi:hypothetical protein
VVGVIRHRSGSVVAVVCSEDRVPRQNSSVSHGPAGAAAWRGEVPTQPDPLAFSA